MDKMPCGNTQAEIDRDVSRKFSQEELEEMSIDDQLILEAKDYFVTMLMNNESYFKPSFSGGVHFSLVYTLNDVLSGIEKEHAFWNIKLPILDCLSASMGEIYDEDPSVACQIIAEGKLPTELEKFVVLKVKELSDMVFGDLYE